MKKQLIPIIILMLALHGCTNEIVEPIIIKKGSITGSVQKGPFINGTSIEIRELDTVLSQTGKSYNTQITNNRGSFEIQNIELVSNYVSLRADGFYYNEISGKKSLSQITLYAISDISDKSTINVNTLSHLEKARVEYLISQGAEFSEAKRQAQSEVLNIFGFALSSNQSSELLDITKEGDDNGILLASSLILQGLRTESELTELLSNISTDLREDGVLSDSSLGSQLINHALYLNTTSIRKNLEQRYSDIGIEANIPNFEKYIQQFIDSTKFEITESLIEYPEKGLYGQNILDLSKTNYTAAEYNPYENEHYSLAANLAKGTKVKIVITDLSSGGWFYDIATPKNWSISKFDKATKSQTFTSINSGESCDLSMIFVSGNILIEYYEMDATEPTKTKKIRI
ncbi:MAG TPA: hypothetical protein GXZ87_10850 [Bacteroidales bacterium]|nr:hypothetical protein [Bacteroidales bacterium]